MLAVENVDLFYGAAQALKSVSVTAEQGKVTCVQCTHRWHNPDRSTNRLPARHFSTHCGNGPHDKGFCFTHALPKLPRSQHAKIWTVN